MPIDADNTIKAKFNKMMNIFIFDKLAVVLPLVVSFDVVDLGVDDVKSGGVLQFFFVSHECARSKV